jgi:hypothetical protein
MSGRAGNGDHRGMDHDVSTPAHVAATASRLRRAAGQLQQWAGSPDAVPSLPVTLAHVEDAVDLLATSMQLMARSVDDWSAEHGALAGEDEPQPEARALRHQLRAIADTLIDARDAYPATCEWARRLLGDTAIDLLRPAAADTSRASHRVVSDLVPRPRRGTAKTGARRQATSSRRATATNAAP